jgi:uncharacterized protein (TIGR00369 family)
MNSTELPELGPFPRALGIEVTEAGPEGSAVRMPVRPDVLNVGGTVQGGAIATLLDVAAGCAVAGHVRSQDQVGRFYVTSHASCDYLRPGTGDELTATAQVTGVAGSKLVVSSEVRAGDKVVALGRATWSAKQRKP